MPRYGVNLAFEKITGLALRDLVLKSISDQKCIPAKIVVSKSEQLLGLIALEKSLGIEVGFGDMDQAIEFEASFPKKVRKGKPVHELEPFVQKPLSSAITDEPGLKYLGCNISQLAKIHYILMGTLL